MDPHQIEMNNFQPGMAPCYRAKHGYVASVIVLISSVMAFLFSLTSSAFAGIMVIPWIPILITCLIGKKARNRRLCWVRSYMVMAIISTFCALAQMGWTVTFITVCFTDATYTDANRVCSIISLLCSTVTFVASIKASCIACDGTCLCCRVPMPPSPDSHNAYRVFENEQVSSEPQVNISPDVDGYYTDYQIEKAESRVGQFDPEENYVMHTSVYKGLVLIINNYHFREANDRPGSEMDLKNVQHVFKQIGYEPVIKTNLSSGEIHRFLDEAVHRINLEGTICHSSVVVVLMSHGEKRGIYGTNMDVVTTQEIKSKFSGRQCPALLGKPKIFFIQACRGQLPTKSALDTDDHGRPSTSEQGNVSDMDSCSSRIPSGNTLDIDHVDVDADVPDNADIYVAYATSEGYFSIRDRVEGSWFIQCLCEALIAYVHIDDLDTIMNRVTRRVTGFTGSVTDVNGKKKKILQTPDISKQGIGKKIYFMPKYSPQTNTRETGGSSSIQQPISPSQE
ncbi:caspase-6-like [Lytechinus pictus]|uniref:caspase-6-like n=1 Tax=Lytechinus pictus TaxID=7653 RepID=UPI0030B9C3FE